MEVKILRSINVPTTNGETIEINLVEDNLYGKKTIRPIVENAKMKTNSDIEEEDSFYDFRPRNIWEIYKIFHQGDRIARSGNYLCGVYKKPEDPADFDYVECDTNHASSCEELARNIFRFYPNSVLEHLRERICNFLRYHDLGELGIGDRPDDGSCDRAEKFTDELSTFCDKIKYLPIESQEELIRDFIIFENALSPKIFLGEEHEDFTWSKDDLMAMQFAKLCDKADAPLHALLYELEGRPGDLMFKKKYFDGITAQDQRYIDEIGESSQSAVWIAHFLDHYNNYEFFPIFLAIIVEAVKEVRGEPFPWFVDFCIRHNICSEISLDLYCA